MSVALKMELPDGAFSALRKSPDEFVREMRLAAAVKWYELTLISQEKAAEIAGLSRADFIGELSRFRVSPFQYSAREMADELSDDV
jgi:predicted HTH domain antitoxin